MVNIEVGNIGIGFGRWLGMSKSDSPQDLIGISISLLLMISIGMGPLVDIVPASSDDVNAVEANVQDQSLVGTPPFQIGSDAAFLVEAAAEGWTGNGTESDPYVIEGYNTSGARYQSGFYITDVSYHIVIKDNHFDGNHSSTSPYNMTYGIYIKNTTCIIEDNWFGTQINYGVYFRDANVTLRNNTFWSNEYGVYGWDSKSWIESNGFYGNHSDAIELRNGEAADIHDNELHPNIKSGSGIYLYYIPTCNVTGNSIMNFSDGIDHYMWGASSTGLVIADNTIINCYSGPSTFW
jgi:hypothetical protein